MWHCLRSRKRSWPGSRGNSWPTPSTTSGRRARTSTCCVTSTPASGSPVRSTMKVGLFFRKHQGLLVRHLGLDGWVGVITWLKGHNKEGDHATVGSPKKSKNGQWIILDCTAVSKYKVITFYNMGLVKCQQLKADFWILTLNSCSYRKVIYSA